MTYTYKLPCNCSTEFHSKEVKQVQRKCSCGIVWTIRTRIVFEATPAATPKVLRTVDA